MYQPLPETGYCWSCGSKGIALAVDPLSPADEKDPVKVCNACAVRRMDTKNQYEHYGDALKPTPTRDPIKDNPDYRGAYVTVQNPPEEWFMEPV